MGGQAMRGYILDVSEYLFRLTTESLRIHSRHGATSRSGTS